jgi:hypothetical protein
LFAEPCIESFFVLAVITFLTRLSRDKDQGLTSYFNVERRLPVDDQTFEDDLLVTEDTDFSRRNETRLVDFLLDGVDHPRGQAEDDNLVGLMVGDISVPLEFQINRFLGVATVPTTRERSDFACFSFEFEVEDFMVDDLRVGIVLNRQ